MTNANPTEPALKAAEEIRRLREQLQIHDKACEVYSNQITESHNALKLARDFLNQGHYTKDDQYYCNSCDGCKALTAINNILEKGKE